MVRVPRDDGGAPCATRVREGGAGASQYTWSAVAVPSPPLSSPTAICPKWTRAGPRVFAAQLAQVRQASLKSTSPMPCQCAMGPGQQAGREMWHAVLGRPAENCGVLSCVLEALEEGVIARTVASWMRAIAVGRGDQASGNHVALVRSMALLVRREC